MAVLHADLVGPLPEGRNSRNQRGVQYILSVVDSATRYLWLLPIRHKTAEVVAATLFDEVISRVSVDSAGAGCKLHNCILAVRCTIANPENRRGTTRHNMSLSGQSVQVRYAIAR